jgi:preprotein translocase SecE subunit
MYAEELKVARTRTRMDDHDFDDNAEEQDEVVVSDRRRRRMQNEEGAESIQPLRKDRPTPSARQVKPRGTGSTGLVNRIPVVRTVVAYFRGVATEMQKVTWPTREETRRLTLVVLGVTIAFSIGLGLLSSFFSWWFQQAFHADSETIFLVVAAVVAVVVGGSYAALRHRI